MYRGERRVNVTPECWLEHVKRRESKEYQDVRNQQPSLLGKTGEIGKNHTGAKYLTVKRAEIANFQIVEVIFFIGVSISFYELLAL